MMEIEWEMWEQEQNKLPAKIQVVIENIPIKKEQSSDEIITNVLPF